MLGRSESRRASPSAARPMRAPAAGSPAPEKLRHAATRDGAQHVGGRAVVEADVLERIAELDRAFVGLAHVGGRMVEKAGDAFADQHLARGWVALAQAGRACGARLAVAEAGARAPRAARAMWRVPASISKPPACGVIASRLHLPPPRSARRDGGRPRAAPAAASADWRGHPSAYSSRRAAAGPIAGQAVL